MNKNASYLPISSWAEDERPRERLMQQGAASLSLNELFAILLRSGVGGESALELSRRILSDNHNDLNELAKRSVRELVNKYKGVGVAKAAAIVAAMEIGRRRKAEEVSSFPVIRSSQDAYEYINSYVKDLDYEKFCVIYLAQSNKVKGAECISMGGINGTVVDIRLLFKGVLDMKATSIIVVHNHPSGMLKPSLQDEETTRKIIAAGKLLDIRVLDHLIIGGNGYYSFADDGKM